ncbi:CgeB family protein [Falsiroseomonas bella]|uniref:CgeB family protein n=1 Tax=Falsiroseomonas bella TaxID=2184016 RepID=UPI0018EE91AB|nr:glycosyltransferase [Falsiroseomonas bella]
MRVVVLGLSLSSSWGNGHATTWRALLRALAARGHEILFLERDVPWYADHRDLADPDFCRLELYADLADLRDWRREIAAADAVIVGSFVPDGVAVGRLVQEWARGVVAFYDIDTPVTLARLARGEHDYLSPEVMRGYDLYLSFTGGPLLDLLQRQYGVRMARVLYCSADPAGGVPQAVPLRWDLSYLGTWSEDRQPGLDRLLLQPARRAPGLRFVVAGAQYPADIAWPSNVERIEHVPPSEHAAFYAASRFTLNLTRADMRRAGWSPSVRLFEAAVCGAPVISDTWPGLTALFRPGEEILQAETGEEVLAALQGTADPRRRAIAAAARARVLAAHTPAHRAAELEAYLGAAAREAGKREMAL